VLTYGLVIDKIMNSFQISAERNVKNIQRIVGLTAEATGGEA